MNPPIGFDPRELQELIVGANISGRTEAIVDLLVKAQTRALVYAIGPRKTQELLGNRALERMAENERELGLDDTEGK